MDIIDFHSHILPSADHGSPSVKVSIRQLTMAKECGVDKIVATPHFYPHKENPENFIARRDHCFKKLCESYGNTIPEIKIGAEVLICDNIEEIPHLNELCIGNSKTILLELPFVDFSSSYRDSVKNLVSDGYNVILAHADRYDPKNIEQLLEVGAKIQLNAQALCSLFLRRTYINWIDRDLVYALGSDIHGEDQTAYKSFIKAIKKLGKRADNIMEQTNILWRTF